MKIFCLLLAAGSAWAQGMPVDLSGEWRMSTNDDLRYAQPEFDDSGWARVKLPWAQRPPYGGIYWLRRTVEVPARIDPSPLALTLGTVSETYEVYVNGQRIGTTGEFSEEKQQIARPRTFAIPGALPPNRSLTVAVRLWRPQQFFRVHSWVIFEKGPYLLTHVSTAPRDAGPMVINERWASRSGDYIIAAVQVMLALLLFGGWFIERSRLDLLWLSVYLTAEAALGTSNAMLIAEDSYPNTRWLEPISPLSVAFLAEFSMAALHLRTPWLRAAIWLGAACSSWLAMALSGQWRSEPLYVALTLTLGSIAWSMWRLARIPGRWDRFARPGLVLLAVLIKVNRFQSISLVNTRLAVGHYAWSIQGLILIGIGSLTAFVLLRSLVADRREKQRLASELEAARAVQQLLLPSATRNSARYVTEAVYQPAQEVGGDFYWTRSDADDALIVLVGDVSGKGLKAAMLVSVAVGILRNEKSASPAAILSALNEGLAGHTGGGFVTACCARFEVNGSVTVANAGHPTPYGDGVEVGVEAGLPLGVMAGVVYEESVVRGERFTFVSDGVVEAENSWRELFGFDRTRDTSTKSAQEIADAAKAWGQNDDITVVTVRRKP